MRGARSIVVLVVACLAGLARASDPPPADECRDENITCDPDPELSLAAPLDLAPVAPLQVDLSTVVTQPDPVHLAPPSAMSTADAIKAILGLLVLFALAFVAGHPRVQRFERRLGVAQLVMAGFPFILLGLLGRAQGVHGAFGLLPQAGLALALATLFSESFPMLGRSGGDLVFSVVALTEILAPVLFRIAIVKSGEAGKRVVAAPEPQEEVVPPP